MKTIPFKMKGFPPHATTSPLRQFAGSDYDETQDIIEKEIEGGAGSTAGSTEKETKKLGKFSEELGLDIAKSVSVAIVNRLFTKKEKKELPRIIPGEMKSIMNQREEKET